MTVLSNEFTEHNHLIEAAEYGRAITRDDLTNYLAPTTAPNLRWYAIKAVGVHRVNSLSQSVVDSLRIHDRFDEQQRLGRIAVWALCQIGDTSFNTAITFKFANSVETSARLFAADLSGESRIPDLMPVAASLMSDSDEEVVAWAALSLSKFGVAAVPFLKEIGSNAQSHSVRILAGDALRKVSHPIADTALNDILDTLPGDQSFLLRESLNRVL